VLVALPEVLSTAVPNSKTFKQHFWRDNERPLFLCSPLDVTLISLITPFALLSPDGSGLSQIVPVKLVFVQYSPYPVSAFKSQAEIGSWDWLFVHI